MVRDLRNRCRRWILPETYWKNNGNYELITKPKKFELIPPKIDGTFPDETRQPDYDVGWENVIYLQRNILPYLCVKVGKPLMRYWEHIPRKTLATFINWKMANIVSTYYSLPRAGNIEAYCKVSISREVKRFALIQKGLSEKTIPKCNVCYKPTKMEQSISGLWLCPTCRDKFDESNEKLETLNDLENEAWKAVWDVSITWDEYERFEIEEQTFGLFLFDVGMKKAYEDWDKAGTLYHLVSKKYAKLFNIDYFILIEESEFYNIQDIILTDIENVENEKKIIEPMAKGAKRKALKGQKKIWIK